MREIKFRGKDMAGIWRYGYYVLSPDPSIMCSTWYSIGVCPHTVGQYTGLKDKNDNLIFEGDIVKGFEKNAVVKIGHPHNELFNPYGVYVEWTKYGLKECQFITNVVFKDLEVIGNIHDNHELLNCE